MHHLPWLADELAERERAGLRRRRRVWQPLPEGWCELDGRRVRNFAGNDYLALSTEPRVLAAAAAALHAAGSGSRGSALVCGRTAWHARLEQTLAAFEGQPAAILFPTGMAANVGVIAALAKAGDVVYCDRDNHASLVDGCRLSGASLRIYRHDDLPALERHLERQEARGRTFLVTDSVFSMDGDLAPLPELCDLAERCQAALIVDEAHATGIFGTQGRGVCEHFGVEERVAVRIGTLSKAIGSLGGFVAGSEVLIEYLWNTARTQVYSTALPPSVCAAATAAIEILREDPARGKTLATHCRQFRELLLRLGVTPLTGSVGPIVPVVVGDPRQTADVAQRLEQRGFLVGAIRPPTVPRGTSRLRVSLTIAHDFDALERLAVAMAEELHGTSVAETPSP